MSEPCPRCGNSNVALVTVDNTLKSRLSLAGVSEQLPPLICMHCIKELESNVSKGSVLLAAEKLKEENKLNLWKSRVNLLKKAHLSMSSRAFGEAASAYEKYMKVLEIVFEKPQNEITPEVFKERAATKELTVVASAYWDLLRIYDQNDKYLSRQQAAADRLSMFLPYTPIAGDIIRKAESFKKQSRNPAIIESFLKRSARKKGNCFIATAVFTNSNSIELCELRLLRDYFLKKRAWGRWFIKFYYNVSPRIAQKLKKFPNICRLLKLFIQLFLKIFV